jgi:thiamine transport system ATP-binding protein
MPILQWRELSRSWGPVAAVDRVSLDVEEGEILAILGPSGSGKSTLLRLTAGLDAPTGGDILVDGRDVREVPPHRRGIGLMFQDYCLFPHLSVEQNIAFGLRMQRMPAARRRRRVEEMLRLVRMEGFGRRDVLSLSGGEQQRVALARSLAPAPRLLMLDEPLGALDVALRGTLLDELADILRDVGVTVLYVTHDHDEALAVATRVAVVNRGRIVQAASPPVLVERPAHAFVASFLGLGCLVDGDFSRDADRSVFASDLGIFPVTRPEQRGDEAARALLVRPAAVLAAPLPGAVPVDARVLTLRARTTGSVARVALLGAHGARYELDMPASDAGAPWTPGREMTVWIDGGRCAVLPR